MKKNFLQLCFSIIFCFGSFSSYSQYQSEGVMQSISYYPTIIDSSLELASFNNPLKRAYWFKDSCIIYEFRIEFQSSDHTSEGTIVKKSYPVAAYIYIDLRTMLCQQYQSFKDTAMPASHFILKPGESIPGWGYGSKQAQIDTTIMRTIVLPDTIIKNTLLKRIKTAFIDLRWDFYTVYYFNCKVRQNIFTLNRALNSIYPCCTVTRADYINIDKAKVTSGTEYNFLRFTLNETERNIFEQWKKNSKKTKLPLLTSSEAAKNINDSKLEHDNPSIRIIPFKK